MSTNNWRTVSISFVPALAGLIGVIIGSVITGYFYWKAQELEVKKALDLESYQSSRMIAKSLAEDAAEYFAIFGDISGEIALQNKTEGQLDDRLYRFYKLGLKISFQTSLPTSLKIITMNNIISNVWSSDERQLDFRFNDN